MANREIKITILGDATGGQKAFADIDRSAEKTEGLFSGLGPKLAVGGAAAGAAILGAGVALYKIGETFDEAFDKLRVRTGASGEELAALDNDVKGVLRDVPTDAAKASDALAAVFQKLGPQANTKQLSEQLLELSRITGTDLPSNLEAGTSAINSWGIDVGQQSRFLDELFRASQQTGITVGDLAGQMAENGAVMRAVGLDWEQGAALIATLSKAGLSASDVMPALSRSLATAAKEGKSARDVFADTFAKIKSAPTDTAAAGVALDVFGAKAGPKLAQLIREGKLSYEGLLGTMAGGKDTIMAAGKDTQDFTEKWTLFKNRILVGLEPLASAVFGGVGKAMDGLGPVADRIADKAAGLAPAFDNVVGGFSAFVGAFKSGDADITSGGWPGWMEQAGATVRGVFDSIAGFVRDNQATFDAWGARLGDIMGQVQGVLSAAFDAISGLFSVWATIVSDLWDRFGDHLWSHIQVALDAVLTVVSGVLTIIQGIFDVFAAIFTGDWDRLWHGLGEILSGAAAVIVGVVQYLVNAVSEMIGAAMAVISALWGFAWHALATLVTDIAGGIVGAVAGMVGSVVGFFSGLPGQVASAMGSLFGIGVSWVQGLLDGLTARVGAVYAWISSFAHNAVHLVTHPWELFSPSRVMMRIGENFMLGLALGMDRGQGAVFGQLDALNAGMAGQLGGLSIDAAAAAPAGGLGAVAGGAGAPVRLENIVVLDGEVVARNTREHFITMGFIQEDLVPARRG